MDNFKVISWGLVFTSYISFLAIEKNEIYVNITQRVYECTKQNTTQECAFKVKALTKQSSKVRKKKVSGKTINYINCVIFYHIDFVFIFQLMYYFLKLV